MTKYAHALRFSLDVKDKQFSKKFFVILSDVETKRPYLAETREKLMGFTLRLAY